MKEKAFTQSEIGAELDMGQVIKQVIRQKRLSQAFNCSTQTPHRDTRSSGGSVEKVGKRVEILRVRFGNLKNYL